MAGSIFCSYLAYSCLSQPCIKFHTIHPQFDIAIDANQFRPVLHADRTLITVAWVVRNVSSFAAGTWHRGTEAGLLWELVP
ncbi:MAG: hypothetical protein Ct9H300mP11_05370 [Chloroflexota bacterium]|nr:MAG: hypothetical protein Ct9H300mP11_05370 [Chloroflexota bacterium]